MSARNITRTDTKKTRHNSLKALAARLLIAAIAIGSFGSLVGCDESQIGQLVGASPADAVKVTNYTHYDAASKDWGCRGCGY